MTQRKWSNIELRQFMSNVSSIHKIIGGRIMFRKQCLLDKSGIPLSLPEFMVQSGERRIRKPTNTELFTKTPREKRMLKACKSDYNENMKALFNKREDWRVLANKHKIHNVPDSSEGIAEVQRLIA